MVFCGGLLCCNNLIYKHLECRAEYGSRTRLTSLGSSCTTDVLIPQVGPLPFNNKKPLLRYSPPFSYR